MGLDNLAAFDRVLFALSGKAGTGTGLAPIVAYTPGAGFAVTSVTGDTSTWDWSILS